MDGDFQNNRVFRGPNLLTSAIIEFAEYGGVGSGPPLTVVLWRERLQELQVESLHHCSACAGEIGRCGEGTLKMSHSGAEDTAADDAEEHTDEPFDSLSFREMDIFDEERHVLLRFLNKAGEKVKKGDEKATNTHLKDKIAFMFGVTNISVMCGLLGGTRISNARIALKLRNECTDHMD